MSHDLDLRLSQEGFQLNQRHEKFRKASDMTLEEIERLTGKSITIRRDLAAVQTLLCNDQAQSDLFGLPAELRNVILALAVEPLVEGDIFQCRSVHPGNYRSDHDTTTIHAGRLDVLLTCRRIWLEANPFALQMFQQAEHSFWLQDNENKPSEWKSYRSWDDEASFRRFNDRLTPAIRRLATVHLYIQLSFVAEDGGKLGDALRLLAAQHGKTTSSMVSACTIRTLMVTLRDPGWHQVDFHEEHFVTRWLRRLLNTAHALKVEVFKLQIVDSKIYLKDRFRKLIEELRDTRHRAQLPGSFSFVPELNCTDESWLELEDQELASGWTDKPLCDSCCYSNLGQSHQSGELLKYQATSLVWKRMVQVRPSHIPAQIGKVEGGRSTTENVLGMTSEKNVIDFWEQKWLKEGSLLKFDHC